LGAKID